MRGRGRLAAAAHAVRHRPGRPPARPGHRPGGRPARGRARTCRTTPSPWPATPPRPPLPASRYNHGEAYAALRSRAGRRLARPAPVPDPAARRPGRRASRPPGGFALVAPAVAPRTAAARSGWPPPTRRAPPLIDPGLPARARRPGPAGSRAGHDPRRPRPAPRSPRLGVTETWPGPRPDQRRAAGLDQAARSAATTTRPAPAGSAPARTTARSPTRSCASTGSTGLRVADASVMPVIPNAHPNATVLAIAETRRRPHHRPVTQPARPPAPCDTPASPLRKGTSRWL